MMVTVLPGFCTMSVDKDLDTGIVAPWNKRFSMAAVDGPSFAYLTVRLTEDEQSFEYGVHALGPDGPEVADKTAGHLRTWDREHRGGPGPRITVYPAGTPDDRIRELPGARVIDKDRCRVTLSWPLTAASAGDDLDRLANPADEGRGGLGAQAVRPCGRGTDIGSSRGSCCCGVGE